MNDSHKTVCEKIYELSRFMLKETGRVVPGYFVIKEDVAILLKLPKELDQIQDNDQFKRACFQTAQMACDQIKGEALVHVTEAWTAEGSKQEMDGYKGRPSEHPNRKESVILLYVSSTGEQSAFVADLIQMADSDKRTLEEGKWITITDIPLAGDTKSCNAFLQ